MIVINSSTRQFNIPGADMTFGVEADAGSERKYFQCPRYVGNKLDIASSFVRINYRNANGEIDSYLVEDLTVDGDNVTFSWELYPKVTAYKGQIRFVMCVVGPDTKVAWHTTLGTGVVLEGLEPDYAVIQAGTADVVAQLIALVDKQTAAVENKGAEWVRNVQSEGTDQVIAVQTAAQEAQTASVAEIEAKGVNTRESIPEDYTALSEAVDTLNRTRGAAIVCEASGSAVVVNDASDLPMQGLRVFGKTTQRTTVGKNLLNVSEENAICANGYKNYTVNDGTIKITNVALFAFKMPVVYGTGYTISLKKNATETTCHFRVYEYSAEPVAIAGDDPSYIGNPINNACAGVTSVAKNYTPSAENVTWVAVGFYTTQVNTITDFMAELGNQVTEYEPYSGGKPSPSPDYPQELVSLEPVVTVYGKNLLSPNLESKTVYGVSFTVNDDGSITVNGTATQGAYFWCYGTGTQATKQKPLRRGKYTVSGMTTTISGFIIAAAVRASASADRVVLGYGDTEESASFAVTTDTALCDVLVSVSTGTTVDNVTIYPMLEVGDVATEYEAPIAPQTLSTTHTLPGIPVTSGGNYTDSDGQQWICDEVDLERGVYVQRVGKIVFTGTEGGWYLNGSAANGDTRLFQLPYLSYSGTKEKLPKAFCTHVGRAENTFESDNTSFCVYNTGGKSYVRLRHSAADLDEFKSFLVAQHTAETPVTIYYDAGETIETTLSETEIAAYRAMHSNYPNTTVLNDNDAHMVVKYAADTKLYIDNKIAALVGGV